jgi:hypothetical protein
MGKRKVLNISRQKFRTRKRAKSWICQGKNPGQNKNKSLEFFNAKFENKKENMF